MLPIDSAAPPSAPIAPPPAPDVPSAPEASLPVEPAAPLTPNFTVSGDMAKSCVDCVPGDEYLANNLRLRVVSADDGSVSFDVVDLGDLQPDKSTQPPAEDVSDDDADAETSALGYDRQALLKKKKKPEVPSMSAADLESD